jgi:protein-tyrosine sulfotransferase
VNQPIFIFSPARSGSTLLRYILDTHPAIYAPPELQLGQYAHALYHVHATLRGWKRPPYSDVAVLATIRASISQILDSETQRHGKEVWCEKSPQNLDYLELLDSLYPEGRFICLYRNPLDNMSSCLKQRMVGRIAEGADFEGAGARSGAAARQEPVQGHPAEIGSGENLEPAGLVREVAHYWVDSVSKLLEFERRRPQCTYRLQYEEIVERTAPTLGRLFSFLGHQWHPELINAVYKTPHDDGPGDPFVRYYGKIRADNVGAGRAFPLPLIADLHPRIAELGRELGYSVTPIEQVAAPPAAAGEAHELAPVNGGRGPRWVFESHLPARLAAEGDLSSSLGDFYRFAVTGESGGTWQIRRNGERWQIVPEDPDAATGKDATVRVQSDDLMGIVEGRLNAIKMLLEGRVVLRGQQLTDRELQTLLTLLRTDL